MRWLLHCEDKCDSIVGNILPEVLFRASRFFNFISLRIELLLLVHDINLLCVRFKCKRFGFSLFWLWVYDRRLSLQFVQLDGLLPLEFSLAFLLLQQRLQLVVLHTALHLLQFELSNPLQTLLLFQLRVERFQILLQLFNLEQLFSFALLLLLKRIVQLFLQIFTVLNKRRRLWVLVGPFTLPLFPLLLCFTFALLNLTLQTSVLLLNPLSIVLLILLLLLFLFQSEFQLGYLWFPHAQVFCQLLK